jgi:hypothetical protein
VFVLPGKSSIPSALVRLHSPLFAATVAKTVATGAPFMWGQLIFYPAELAPPHKESLCESIKGACQEHGGPTHLKRIVTEVGKGVAESLRALLVTIAAEAAKRAIWG